MTVAVALLAFAQLPSQVVTVQPGDLIAKPAAHDGKTVRLSGSVADAKNKVSKRGNAYTTFSLVAGGKKVAVYMRGHLEPPVQDGEALTVTGVFSAVRKVGTMTVKDQVDASAVEGRPYGVVRPTK
jgi:cytochrome c-type biogenesis protein CcmE